MTVRYFAYGSNMLAERLGARCPSASFKAVASAPDWVLSFSKRSKDNSGKATIRKAPGDRVFGVVYEIDESDLPILDRYEGVGNGYVRDDSFVAFLENSDTPLTTAAYIADPAYINDALRPYDWYHGLVLAGARQYNLPTDYISMIESSPSVPDEHLDRQERLQALALLDRL